MTPVPHLVYFLGLRAAYLMAALTLARVSLCVRFARDVPFASLAEALALGARFDARLVGLLTLAALPFLLFSKTSPFSTSRAVRATWITIEGLLALLLATFVIADFAHYAYLFERLNAGVITLAVDVREATGMVWQSYPIVRMTLGAFAFTALTAWVHRLLVRATPVVTVSRRRLAASTAINVVIASFFIFGRLGQYPLRWSESAAISPPEAGAMSLNPVLHFFDTLAFARKGFRPGDDLPYRDSMTARLGASGDLGTAYERIVHGPADGLPRNLNVVVVIMESFSGYKSSVFGNPLDPTPVMKRVADAGLSFERHFTSHHGTARGVFAVVTGVPDVQLGDTASRNPRAIRHQFPLEDYGFVERHYFIGGSTRWANVRGVLLGTIPGLLIHEEGEFKSPRTDVWGVADGDLLPEAAQILAGAKRPFFAVIQTASNHRPFSIPDAHLPHCPRSSFDEDRLVRAGFEDSREWDGMHYMDWSIGRLLEEAKAAGWHDDTVFVFLGDHGITGHAGEHMPAAFSKLPFTDGHTPLIFYAPGHIKPGRVSEPCMQADTLPTVAGFFRGDFRLRCLGRNARAPLDGAPPMSFMISHNKGPRIAVFDGRWYAATGIYESDPVRLHDTQKGDAAQDVAAMHSAKAAELGRWARAHYHVSACMLLNNAPSTPPENAHGASSSTAETPSR